MCYKLITFCIILLIASATARPHPHAKPQSNNLQHIAVIENEAYERTLPNHLTNPFYKSPRVRELLAKSSWFGPGEEPVFDRQAEKIPRIEIYNVLSHAGLLPQKGKLF